MTHDAHHAPPQSYEKGPHAEHHGGVQIYIWVMVALLVLTSMSYATQLPFWSTIFGDSVTIKRTWMMAVSCTKAMLVILFFMHLKWEANWKWIVTVPASMMSALLIFALVPDVGLRYYKTKTHAPSHDRLIYAADPTTPPKAVDEAADEVPHASAHGADR